MICLRYVTSEVVRQRDMRGFHEAVTHKMRTPLTVMLGSLSLLAKHGDKMSSKDVLAFSNTAFRGAERLRDTVEDILQYLYASGQAESSARFELGHLQALVEEISSHLGIESVTVSCPPDLCDACILLSRRGTELAMWEILENTKKFHPQQEPQVEVIAARKGPTQVGLQIRDNGLTISAEHLAQIWTPYYQGEKYFTGEAKGTGLGLATVAAMVWEVGGTCYARNRSDGPGVTIELVLPLEEEHGKARC